jgi:CelD/BcsL family acetyltransferase involved in cellulose biosynthesis
MGDLEALEADWVQLYRDSGSRNPFVHPIWLTCWAQHFLQAGQLYVLVVRDAAGALMGVAPFYRRHYRLGPLGRITTIQLLGAVEHVELTELSQVLIRPGQERPVLGAIMDYLGAHPEDWDWIEVILPPEQGWFEPQWLGREESSSGRFVLHKGTRACVVLPLPASWDELRARLKRNIKESMRHGANSLKREGLSWRMLVPEDPATFSQALDRVVALHRKRSSIEGKTRHADSLEQDVDLAFLRVVARRMFEAGHLTPYVLEVEGEAAAAGLVLHGNRTTFFSLSGFEPRWWSYNVATTLVAECLRAAIARGDTLANLSPGPHVAKLRWSEQLELYQEFVVVGGRRRSQLAFSAFWHLRTAAMIRRERHRHERV